MSTVDRKAELERKKAKLEQMRLEKKRKEEERKKKTEVDDSQPAAPNLRSETEAMLKDLGISSKSPAASSHPGAPKTLDLDSNAKTIATVDVSSLVTQAPSKKLVLTISKITQTNIAPRDNVQYDKTTQTIVEATDKEARPWDYYALTYVDIDDDNDSMDSPGRPGQPRRQNSKGATEQIPGKDAGDGSAAAAAEKPPELPKVVELPEEERNRIMASDDFCKFFDRASRVIERAMTEKIDLFMDYTGEDQLDREGGLAEGEQLKLNRQFFDDRWSRHRTITSLDWSTQYPELLLASYNNNEDAPNEPDGVALVWNIKYKKTTPEYIFHCQSPVMSSCFAKFHPNLIVGGTYSGQIVLWDNRSRKRTPVQRTPLNAASHTHPVYCVNVVGTQNAYNLISISTDGKMCSWNLDMLSQPQDSIELQHKQAKSVAVTCMSFMSADVNNFVVGSEEGVVYSGCRHGSKAGISDMYDGHLGPITGIDTHNVPGVIDFSQYFITSSFDWTVKLWSAKENKLLYSFEDNSEYVYDVQWSPIHPALFSTVDGSGRLDVWNLNNDTEVPTASMQTDVNLALNRCRWHQNGLQIAAGDDLGKVHIYDIAESLATPRTDEWSRFSHTLQDLASEQSDQMDDIALSSHSTPLR